MRRLGQYLFVRHRRNWVLLIRFALVGVTGVVVNLLVLVVARRLGPPVDDPLVAIWPTRYSVRWYHLYSTLAFLAANLWNFQLNRSWTFRSAHHRSWAREYGPFLLIGFAGQLVGLVLLTLLMHPESPVHLPTHVLDDSTGLRTRLYWAQLVVIVVVTPLSFVLNKIWTFAAVRGAPVSPAVPPRAGADHAGR